MAVTFSGSSYIGTAITASWVVQAYASTQFTIQYGSYTSTTTLAAHVPGSTRTNTFTIPHTAADQIGGAVSATMMITIREGSIVQTGSKTISVPATAITSVTTPVTLGVSGGEAVTFTPTATSLKYGVKYEWGPLSVWSQGGSYIEPASITSYTDNGTVPLTWSQSLRDQMSDTFTIYLYTYTSSNKTVGYVTKTAKFKIPSYTPTFNYALAEGTQSGFGVYVQGRSTLQATFSDMASSYSASVSTLQMTVDGKTYTKAWASDPQNLASNKFTSYNSTMPVTLSVTDSRGQTKTVSTTIAVYQYFNPTIETLTAETAGTTVTVTVAGNIASVNNLNTKTITIVRKNTSTQAETTVVNGATLNAYAYTYTLTETVNDVDTVSYEYIVTVADTVNSITASKSTGIICISRLAGGLGVCLFQEASEQGFWIRDVDYTISNTEFLAIAGDLAEEYNKNTSYAVGDYCLYSSTLYRCIAATTGTWTAADWEVLS